MWMSCGLSFGGQVWILKSDGECVCIQCNMISAILEVRKVLTSGASWLPLKCPLCDGQGHVGYLTKGLQMKTIPCGLCRGTGKRPTDDELEQRRATRESPK